MVKLNKIYTRTGDDGFTGLVGGQRRPKYHLRIEAVGTIEEANAAIGLARLHANKIDGFDVILTRIQNDLFDLGADLANPEPDESLSHTPLRISTDQVSWIETQIDQINEVLSPLNSFILPGGTPLASAIHLARTIVRRAERIVSALAAQTSINSEALVFINRLSDLMFVLARQANDGGEADLLWQPGENR